MSQDPSTPTTASASSSAAASTPTFADHANTVLRFLWRYKWTLVLVVGIAIGAIHSVNKHQHPTVGNGVYSPAVGDCVAQVSSKIGADLHPVGCEEAGAYRVSSLHQGEPGDVKIRSVCAPEGATAGWVLRDGTSDSGSDATSSEVVCLTAP